MSIAMEDGFYQDHERHGYTSLGIETLRSAECIQRIIDQRIRGVFGSPHHGFTGTNLDFLRAMPWIESVWFWDTPLDNIDGLYALGNLRDFGVSSKRPGIDFSRFPKLRQAVVEPKNKDRGLDALRELALLHLWHYRPKDATFTALRLPASLTQLQINWANAASLETLPPLPNLRRLEIHRCRNLVNLGVLSEKFPMLEHVIVAACGRVTSAEGERAIQNLHTLSHVYIGGVHLV